MALLLAELSIRVIKAAHGLSAEVRFCPAILQDWTTHEIDCTWLAAEGPAGLERALHRLCADADAAIAAGARFTLLTDRASGVALSEPTCSNHGQPSAQTRRPQSADMQQCILPVSISTLMDELATVA